MPVDLRSDFDGKIIMVRVGGKLTQEDYDRFVPEFEQQVERYDNVRVLFEMDNFHGWTLGAMWEDIKISFRVSDRIERIAMVGEHAWQANMARLCRPFTRAEVRYFNHSELEQAQSWVYEGIMTPSQG